MSVIQGHAPANVINNSSDHDNKYNHVSDKFGLKLQGAEADQ